MTSLFYKDPDAVLDYKFDWSSWLPSGDTIASRVVTAADGITKDSDSITDTSTSVTVWLSGGTANSSYQITCAIVTADGREDDRSMLISVREK